MFLFSDIKIRVCHEVMLQLQVALVWEQSWDKHVMEIRSQHSSDILFAGHSLVNFLSS